MFQSFETWLLYRLMVIISLELTRVNQDRNIFSIYVELTSTFFFTLQRFGPSPSRNFKSILLLTSNKRMLRFKGKRSG